MFTVTVGVGRLIEARLTSLADVDEVGRFERAMGEGFASVGGRSVVCADWRQANILPPAVADRLTALLQRGNPHVERSAILLAREHATFNLQVERLVREAQNPARKTFRETASLVEYLSAALTPSERARVAEFLAEG
jgi:hypothetical protein